MAKQIRNYSELNREKRRLRGQAEATRQMAQVSWHQTQQQLQRTTGEWTGWLLVARQLSQAFLHSRRSAQNEQASRSWMIYLDLGLTILQDVLQRHRSQ